MIKGWGESQGLIGGRRIGESRVREAVRARRTALREVDRLALPIGAVLAKISNELLLVNLVDSFNFCSLDLPTVLVTVDHFLFEIFSLVLFSFPLCLFLEIGETPTFILGSISISFYIPCLGGLVQVLLQPRMLLWMRLHRYTCLPTAHT